MVKRPDAANGYLIMMRFFRLMTQSYTGAGNLKRLGYPLNTRLLIVHADDLGLSHSSNIACIKAFENGRVTSGSVMMPCPFSSEMVDYAKLHPDWDIGIHLTLTSEWVDHQWRPLLGNKVSSLTNSSGFLFETREELETKAQMSEVEQELRSQIEMAVSTGMSPTHLDCHMFAGILNPEFLKIYIQLGREYGLPVLLNHEKIKKWFRYDVKRFISEDEILVDQLFIATPRSARKGLAQYYSNVLQTLNPGLNCLLVHPAFHDEEMKLLTAGHLDYNSVWRQADYDFFTSDECRRIIKENNIQLITWREIKERLQPYG
ncbi:MAG: polysaccharide deacetylase family protein [Bacteroidia bacterium]|nr:polysaccharide deacetylase family protein [Bacteroidia bacterium]